MPVLSRKTPFILLLGDIAALCAALWLTLVVRYPGMPDGQILADHFYPFSFLFLIWVAVYFIAGLYERQVMVSSRRLSQSLFYSQIANLGLAAVFFYFVTFTSISPKTNLVIFLVLSSALILLWRLQIYGMFSGRKKERALLVGSGAEMRELLAQVNGSPRYQFHFEHVVDLDGEHYAAGLADKVRAEGISLIVVDFYNSKAKAIMPDLYALMVSNRARFADMHAVYEDVFDRVALSILGDDWFVTNFSMQPKVVYDSVKRIADFLAALVFGAISLVFYPFVYIAIKLDDHGPIFVMQERVGKDSKTIRIPKFRSMRTSDRGVWVKEHDDRITRVGKFLRQTRIDELPQLYSVLKGDMSLVGPRPDIYDLGMKLLAEIPYYQLRNVIKPGLSGWAQIRQELPPQSLEETKMRLAYDFYYIKNRSLGLDLKIAAQTLATLASRVGK
ncbi:MAG: sugar transferase [bacterium]|nr:sugar transferase [bacterium]